MKTKVERQLDSLIESKVKRIVEGSGTKISKNEIFIYEDGTDQEIYDKIDEILPDNIVIRVVVNKYGGYSMYIGKGKGKLTDIDVAEWRDTSEAIGDINNTLSEYGINICSVKTPGDLIVYVGKGNPSEKEILDAAKKYFGYDGEISGAYWED